MVENLSLPEELQKILDKRIGMGMVGDMQRYTQFQVANSIPAAAANEGGLAGIGAGLAPGSAIGQAMAQAIGQAIAAGRRTGRRACRRGAGEAARMSMQLLEKLHDLKTKGILTEDEFNTKKAELLKRIG